MSNIIFKPYSWEEHDDRVNGTFQFRVFCHVYVNKVWKRALIRLNHKPWMRAIVTNTQLIRTGEVTDAEYLETSFGYDPNKQKVPVVVHQFDTIKEMKNQIRESSDFQYVETDIPQVVRFLIDNNFKYCYHYRAKCQKVPDDERISTCDYEYEGESSSLRQLSDQQIIDVGYPSYSVLSFDGEMYSHRAGNMPDPTRPSDPVFGWGMTYDDGYGNTHHIRIYTKPFKHTPKDETDIVIFVKSELELVRVFEDMIRRYDPDILLGHNIFNFDLPYLDHRIAMDNETWSNFSRIINHVPKLISKKWDSSAYDNMNFFYVSCPGRIWIDTLTLLRRVRPGDPSHKLGELAKKYLRGKTDKYGRSLLKVDLEVHDMFRFYRQGKLENIDDYLYFDSLLPLMLFKDLQLQQDLVEKSNIMYVSPFDIYSTGETGKGYYQEWYEHYHSGYVLPLKKEPKKYYVGALVQDARPAVYTNVPYLDFQSMYPNIIIKYNMCSTTIVLDSSIPDEWCHVVQYQLKIGGKNGQPGPVQTCRFIRKDAPDGKGREGCFPRMLRKLLDERKKVRQVEQPKHPKGSIPWLVLEARQNALKIAANSGYGSKGTEFSRIPCWQIAPCTTYMGRILITQCINHLKEKYNAETVYGDTDSCMMKFKCFDHLVPVMVEQKDKDGKVTGHISAFYLKMKEIASELSSLIEGMVMELECIWDAIFPITQKLYAGYKMDPKQPASFLPHNFVAKGLKNVRKDNCTVLRRIEKNLIEYIMQGIKDDNAAEKALDMIDYEIMCVMNGMWKSKDEVEKQFKCTSKFKKTYKEGGNGEMKRFGERVSREGLGVAPGERFDYVYINKAGARLQGDMIHLMRDYDETRHSINSELYVKKKIAPHIGKILNYGFDWINPHYVDREVYPRIIVRRGLMWDIRNSVERVAPCAKGVARHD